ncbi:putative mitochondrial protein [Cucumis melo var. makuwa]|uniref:Mitochondrial protein n=1 Tax=Cucumis melo var. makuwa TaxID=1194695 RepID=A0A5A7TUJ9_CUCMM|nr:putative mitochondrial protein [Cucumis melo var. makuwa]TYK16551.1 putative mitochondrial protein [Cucumis melo var. makuwa]
MDEEIEAIEELTDLPKGHQTIRVKWVYKTKLKENGEVDKYKAHLVAKGYKHEFGVDYKEVFAPVARHDIIRLMVSLAAQNSWPIFQLDVESTFLHGELQEKVFVDQPLGYVKVKDEHKVYRLKKALYRLNQAPRAWFRMANCNLVSMPMEVSLKLVRDPEGRKIDNTLYKKIVGSLMYLTATEPDIMHAVSIISRYMEFPTVMHLLVAKRIFRYLQGTSEYGLFYKKSEKSSLVGLTDSDYAGDLGDRKSTFGYVFMMNSTAISWCSKKQSIVTLSTTEAEFVVATVCTCQNPVLHGRSKHIDVKFHFIRDLTRDGVVELYYCKSEDQIVDIMTKPLKLPAFQKLWKLLGVCAINKSLN